VRFKLPFVSSFPENSRSTLSLREPKVSSLFRFLLLSIFTGPNSSSHHRKQPSPSSLPPSRLIVTSTPLPRYPPFVFLQ
jgi:hypothetical protein